MDSWQSFADGLGSFDANTDQHRQNLVDRHDETCRWVFETSEYREWIEDQGKFLLMTGPPGVGKSVLASVVIEELRRQQQIVTYWFCGRESTQNPNALARCVLKQLVEETVGGYTPSSSIYELRSMNEDDDDPGQLWDALTTLLRTINQVPRPVYLVIDGLDHLSDDTLGDVTSTLQRLHTEHNFDVFVTARCLLPQLDILGLTATLEYTDGGEDLNQYIIASLRSNTELLPRASELAEAVMEGSEGLFSFADQILDCLLEAPYSEPDGKSPAAWTAMDTKLGLFFDGLLERVLSQPDTSATCCAFRWILFARRPLSMRELQHALADNATKHLWNTKEPLHQAVEPLYHTVEPDTVIAALRGLVRVDKITGMVSFFHSAAEGYFRQRSERFPNAQEEITASCVRLLTFACLPSPSEANWVIEDSTDIKREQSTSSRNGLNGSEDTAEETPAHSPWLPRMMDKLYHPTQSYSHQYRPAQNPFQVKLQMPSNKGFFQSKRGYEEKLRLQPSLQYAACNWGYHAQASAELSEDVLDLLRDKTRVEGISQTIAFEKAGYTEKFPQDVTGLHLAAYFGLAHAATRLLKDGVPVSSRDSRGETPLWWAVKDDQHEVARLLSFKDTVTLHLLIRAKQKTLMPLLEALLEAGYNVNTADIEKWTPLHAAVASGDVQVAERLVVAGADVDARDVNGATPLGLALESRNFELIQILVANGADTRGVDLERIRGVFGLQDDDSLEMYEDGEGRRILRQIPREFSWTAANEDDTGRFSINLLNLNKHLPGLRDLSVEQLHSLKPDAPFVLRIHQSTDVEHEKSTWVYYLKIELPAASLESRKYRALGICWNVAPHTDDHGVQSWTTTAHLSNLQDIWLPSKGIELFRAFVSQVRRRWGLLVKNTISMVNSDRRREVLGANGGDPNLLGTLLKDALKSVNYRQRLQVTAGEAKVFATEYCHRHDDVGELEGLLGLIDAFAEDVGDYIGQLDEISRDLIQMEFNLVSINEARQSVKMAASLKRLSWITFIFLPLTFVATSFGMNIDILAEEPPWYYYLPFAGATILLTSAVWLIFKYSRLEEKIERVMASVLQKRKNRDGQLMYIS
ncbi:ankyrin repeat-containing protein [Colletotrichum karsti]|uniref:Ankyrin repeat-containing protein n=1 Tax=Colletotrichum karsti TaxID=1095194 RepID=A0A9P6LL90_9PEZI|nr:ankyrin repeat-containing protein [Colletotrichum karsti]KAF9876317.1 ankyrin repeat-containing protein [Colletotrichum karsti]